MSDEKTPKTPSAEYLAKFQDLDYEAFRRLAVDQSLSPNERIGFPDSYRGGKDEVILRDIVQKLPNLQKRGQRVVDVGPGCAQLCRSILDLCRTQSHEVVLVDSPEMLAQIPDEISVRKVAGFYPRDTKELLAELRGKVDVLLTYSVAHYVFKDASFFDFVDASLELLAPGGELLIGDIPNVSQRKRFFSSESGIAFHRRFTGSDTSPAVEFNRIERGQFDDAVLLGVVSRCRAAGFDAYVLPQAPDLPMANRREDLLIRRP